jgi:hypothetical protein
MDLFTLVKAILTPAARALAWRSEPIPINRRRAFSVKRAGGWRDETLSRSRMASLPYHHYRHADDRDRPDTVKIILRGRVPRLYRYAGFLLCQPPRFRL